MREREREREREKERERWILRDCDGGRKARVERVDDDWTEKTEKERRIGQDRKGK